MHVNLNVYYFEGEVEVVYDDRLFHFTPHVERVAKGKDCYG